MSTTLSSPSLSRPAPSTILQSVTFLFTLISYSQQYYRVVISPEAYSLPCDISNSNQVIYAASTTFDRDASSTQNGASLGGWFFPRGYLDQYYTIFSFHEPQSYQIYSLAYSPNNYSIRETLGVTVSSTRIVPEFTTLQWFYIRSYIQYSNSILTGGTSIWRSRYPFYSNNLSNDIEHQYIFTKSALYLNIGNSNVNLNNVVPSCTVSRFICAFNAKVDEDELLTPRDNIQGMGAELLWHYDKYYTSMNPGKLMSYGKSEDALVIPTLSTNPFYFHAGSTLMTDYIKAKSSQGFTANFSFKVYSLTFTRIRLLTLVEDVIYVDLLNADTISLSGLRIMTPIDFTEWIHLLVQVKFGTEYQIMISTPKYHNINRSITITDYRTLRLKFGSTSNINSFQINTIRIYQGIYISGNSKCFFQIATLPTEDCLSCQDNYLLDLQNNYTCVPDTDTPNYTYPFQRQWEPYRVICPPEMLHDLPSSTTCRCRNQHYRVGNQCFKCKRYCNGCTGSAGNCVTRDPLRNSSGICLAGTFDDGYNCKSVNQLIPNQAFPTHFFANPAFTPAGVQLSQSQIFNDAFLKLQGESAFLFTFSYKPASITYSNSPIATVQLNSVEVITILFSSNAIGKKLILRILGNIVWTYYVHPNNASWYALWSDLSTTTLLIHTNGMLYSNSFAISIPQPIVNPIICIGSCSSVYVSGTPVSIGALNNRPFRFIVNTLNPTLYDEQILNLILVDAVVLANFVLNLQTYLSSKLGVYESTDTPGVTMNFYTTRAVVTEQLKGFGFVYQSTFASIDIGQIDFPISFSTSIWIETINSQTSLVSFNYSNELVVEYFLVPSDLQQNVIIRICLGYDCQDTQSAKLYVAETSFLAILTQDLSPFSIEFLRISFKVMCNKASETLTFINVRPMAGSFSSSPTPIYFGSQSEETKNYLFYLNRIRIINGNSYFYEDLTGSNNCFLSLNNNPTICVSPKPNYVLYNDTTITEQECLSSPTTIRFINENTRECVDSHQVKQACQTVDHKSLKCVECSFGFYLPLGSSTCQPCSAPCTSCIDSSSNCLTCMFPMQQLAPTCDCVEEELYLNPITFQCQGCDSKCDSCSGFSSSCDSCALHRNSPPLCQCEESYVEDAISGECVHISCEIQCNSCSIFASNCDACKTNRNTPPQCDCLPNAYEISDGTCEMCITGTYFSPIYMLCLPCQLPCAECEGSATHCLACDSDLKLINNQCYCTDGFQYITQLSTGNQVCAREMDILSFSCSDSGSLIYTLEFTFPKQLYAPSIEQHTADKLISVYLNDVQSDWFTLTNPRVSSESFHVDLVPHKSFAVTSGYAMFLQVKPFVSSTEEDVLSPTYLKYPFKINSIGPLVFPKSDTNFPKLDMQSENAEMLYMIQGLQLVFYFLNSLQPTVIILLLKLQLPPNLYSFLEMIGMYVYPDVQSYQESLPTQTQQLFDFNIEQNRLTDKQEFMFQRLGFLKSIFTTAPLMCFKYMLIVILLFLTSVWVQLQFRNELAIKAKAFLINQLITENEVNLLISVVSLLITFDNTQSDSWTSRYGFYCSILIIVMHAYAFVMMIRQIYQKQRWYSSSSGESKGQTNNNQNPFYIVPTERIKQKRLSESKLYFIFQWIKKYLILVVIFFFRNFQHTVCLLCALIFLVSAVSTCKMKPYLKKRSRYVKIIVDMNFVLTWILLARITSVEFNLYSRQPFDDDLVTEYFILGNVVVVVLAISNLIYIVEQILLMIDTLQEIAKKKFPKKQQITL